MIGMQKRQTPDILLQRFHLRFDKDLKVYFLLDNSSVNQLYLMHLGNKFEKSQNKNQTWYLHPQQALYMVSVHENGETSEYQKQKAILIRLIYKNCSKKEIDILHFYLIMRKRNKFCRRIDDFSVQKTELSPDLTLNEEGKFVFFRIYDCHEDWKNYQNQKVLLFVSCEQQISKVIDNPSVQTVKTQNGLKSLYMCIFQNCDYVITQISD